MKIAIAALAVLMLAGCSTPAPVAETTAGTLTGSITVFAAASLKNSFTELGADFEKANPGATVAFSFAGSSDLVAQIKAGAPADVFASADEANMAKLGELASSWKIFATNVLEIAVPPANPAGIKKLADLAKPGVKTVLCAPQVPCGAASLKVADAAGLKFSPVSQESSVTDVLGKVSSGEADAGLVYVTDVKAAGKSVKGVTFPESAQVVNSYPIAALKGAKDDALAAAFIDYVRGKHGSALLKAAGFGLQ